jgi:hypothetical protein
VDEPQRIPLLLDDAFQLLKTLRRVLVQLRACIAQRAEMGFELTDGSGVAIGRDRPSLQNRRAEFGQRDETFFERTAVGHSTEMLDLFLQTRDTLLESAFVRLQLRPVRAWYTNPSADPTALRILRRRTFDVSPGATRDFVFRVERIISSLTTWVASVTWSTFHERVRLLMAREVTQ